MLKKDILDELRAQFDITIDGGISLDHFMHFYDDVSASFNKDEDFAQLVANSWLV